MLIKSDEICYTKPALEDFLTEYNNLLASILVKNQHSLKFVASATIDRLEAQTHFFEKIQKYIQMRTLLAKDPSLVIELIPEDYFLYRHLYKEFNGRIKKAKNVSKVDIKEIVKKKWLIREILFITRLTIIFLKTLLFSIAVPQPKTKYQSIVRTYFDYRCKDKQGELREEYFGPFIVDLVKEFKTLMVYKILHPKIKELKEYLKLRRTANFESCLLESFLNPVSIVRAFILCLLSRIRLKDSFVYAGADITGLLQQSLDEDYFSGNSLGVYLEYEAAKMILGSNPERLLMPYENQCWGKVYPFIKSQSANIRTSIIGFQHSGFSFKVLNYFPSRIEKDLPLFPDKIVTVGNITKRTLEDKANYPSAIVEGAALRQANLVNSGSFHIASRQENLTSKIAYAFSYDVSKYKNIIKVLTRVFKNSSIYIYLKIHPDYNEKKIIGELGTDLPQNFCLAQEISWNNIYEEVDCILYDDNSIGLEGMINGVKTFMLDIEPFYDCNRIFYFNERQTELDINGLFKLKQALEEKTFLKGLDINRISPYISSYYNVYSKDKYFKAYL